MKKEKKRTTTRKGYKDNRRTQDEIEIREGEETTRRNSGMDVVWKKERCARLRAYIHCSNIFNLRFE